MEPRIERTVRELEGRGYGVLTEALEADHLAELRAIAARLARLPARPWSESDHWHANARWDTALFAGEGRNRVLLDCLGVDAALDAAIERFVELPAVAALLDHVVGVDRRIWFVQLRWACAGAEEYPLHQDVFGELALCVYLDDHVDGDGQMVYWPGSHRWPRSIRSDVPLEPRWVPGRVRHAPGRAGDLCAFFNKTWHGRTSSHAGERLVFLISFVPPGPVELPRRPPASVRAQLGPELRRVTTPEAALPFGDRPTDSPPLSTRIETPMPSLGPACTFGGYGERATLDYAWAWCRSRACAAPDEPTPPATLDVLRDLALLARGLPDYPRETAAALEREVERRGGESASLTART